MDKNQLEKYRQEMMKIYSKSTSLPEEKNPPKVIEEAETVVSDNERQMEISEAIISEEIGEVNPNAPDDTAWSQHSDEHPRNHSSHDDNLDSRYPEPDLDDLNIDLNIDSNNGNESDAPPEYASEESLGDSTGFILVNVRTGDESWAIEGALVMITAIVDGRRMIIASGLTNESGTTQRFAVPVPSLTLSQQPFSQTRPYNLFDISVTAKGFFNARSVDVPVFSGITSVQNFSMIPVPLMMNENDETVTIYNQEPNFGNPAKQGG